MFTKLIKRVKIREIILIDVILLIFLDLILFLIQILSNFIDFNHYRPWILEVNLSPSLAFDSPLDYQIKSNLIVDALNIIGLRRFIRKREVLGK